MAVPWLCPGLVAAQEGCGLSCENITGPSCVYDLCYRTANSSGITDLVFKTVTASASVETSLDYITVLSLNKIITIKANPEK